MERLYTVRIARVWRLSPAIKSARGLSRPAPDNTLLFACIPKVRNTRRTLNAITAMLGIGMSIGVAWWIALALWVGSGP